MISTFRDKETRKIAIGQYSRRFPVSIQSRARVCLERIAAMVNPSDLAVFPAMRLKRLSGPKKHLYSVRINDQYRVCFEWVDGNAINVEITDYH